MSKVHIYTSTYCGYCNAAKNILNNKRIEFVEIDLSSDHELRVKLYQKHKWRTVPIIVINDRLIGGFHELLALERKGDLDSILKPNPED